MKAFRYIKYCAKGFFSKIIIMESIWLRKMAKKLRKSIFLITELESEKVIEFRPPLFFNFRGGHTSSTFSISCSFLRYAFLGSKFTFQNTDFWEKSFYYSSFYTKKLSYDHWGTMFWDSSTNPNAWWWLMTLYAWWQLMMLIMLADAWWQW